MSVTTGGELSADPRDGSSWSPDSPRWAMVAASSRADAEAYAARRGARCVRVWSKGEVAVNPLGFRRELRARNVDVVAVHSRSWERQRSAQMFELALALAPVNQRVIVDDDRQAEYVVSGRRLALALSAAPATLVRGLGAAGSEVAAFEAARRRPTEPIVATRRDVRSVIAVWYGLDDVAVGGEITHIAGILGGFRALGLRIGLVTAKPAPSPIRAVADEVVIVPPGPSGARLTTDMEEITANRAMRDATVALARRMGPSVLYQRHRQFLWAAGEAARMARVPLILEWNNSEAWMRQRMHYRRRRDERLLDPLVRRVERYIVRRADLTVAVSTLAADMALAAGVNAARLTVVRNGVDVAAIKQLVKRDQPARGREPVIGWVGVFCQWHGVEVLVRALPLLPPDTRLLLVGDGGTRAECEALASALGVSERVEFTGLLPHAEAVRRLASCDILVSPHVEMPNQRFFGSPTKLFEYMAIGRPIVASRLEQLSEVLEDGVTARLVVPGDERKLADTLRQVLESPGRGEALGVAAQRASERHSWDRRAREIFDRLVVAGGAANGTGQQWAT